MGLLIKKNICLMGLLYMPYGPTHKEQIYALWAYSQTINIYMPYGPTCKNKYICLMGLLTKNKYICLMGLLTKNK